ncbi:MAG: diacylglycerol/lipid kinase family protein [Roseburia sp.]
MEEKKRLLFVFNPHSGKAQIKNQLLDIVDTMVKAGYEVTVYPTQARGDAITKVECEAGNYDLVVCCGGDGTLDEAVTGMMHCEKKVPLGYIPAGSTNDFATSLKIPKEMQKAAGVSVQGKLFPCDIGSFNGDYFVYVAAFGLFTEVSYKTSQEWKNVLGHAAYILEGAKCLHDIPSYLMQVEYDNVRIQDEFIYGMITNSTSVGGFKGMTGKDVKLDDGLFEVTLIKKPRNPIELNEIIASLINLVDDTDKVYSFKTNEVRFTAKEALPWTLDGEYGGDHAEVVVRNLCQAVEIMVDPGED